MKSKDNSKQAWALGVASILAVGGVFVLPSPAQGDQLGGGGGPAAVCTDPGFDAGVDIDDIVAQRKVEMARAFADRH